MAAKPWPQRILEVCTRDFGCGPDDLVDALEASASASGYTLGALAEIYLRRDLEKAGYHVQRIPEKWEGEKKHHGDYYVSLDGTTWFVVECKGLKSNAEKWGGKGKHNAGKAIEAWSKRLRQGEKLRWWQSLTPERREAILKGGDLDRVKIFQTHLVASRSKKSGRTIATPLKGEFHLLAIDLFLRTRTHEFIFVASADLEPSISNPAHLKQNYTIDILFEGVDTEPTIPAPWSRDFAKVFGALTGPVNVADMNKDDRKPGERRGELIATLDEAAA